MSTQPFKSKSLRAALFFSSKSAAQFEDEQYDLRVSMQSEEYEPLFAFNTKGPYYNDVFYVHMARKQGDVIPYVQNRYGSIDTTEEFLSSWKIDIEQGWFPIEDEETA